MSWITTTCTSAEELGLPDKKNSSTSQKFVLFNLRRGKNQLFKNLSNLSEVALSTSQNFGFCLWEPVFFHNLLRHFSLPPWNFFLVHTSANFSTKHVKVTAFSWSRVTLRAVRSDRLDRVLEDCQCWSWTIWPHGTKSWRDNRVVPSQMCHTRYKCPCQTWSARQVPEAVKH